MAENNTSRVAKNTLFLFIRMILVLCVSLYTSRVILDVLGVEDFGIYNLVGSVVVLFSFLKQALNNATYRFLACELGKNDLVQLRKTFSMAVHVHTALAIIVLILCEAIGLYILNYKLNIPHDRMAAANVAYQLSILTFCVSIIQTPYNSLIIVHERMSFYAFTSVVEVILKLAVCFLLSIADYDKLIAYAALLLCVSLIIYGWYIVHCFKTFQESHVIRIWDKQVCYSMIRYSGWSMLVNASDIGVRQMNSFYLNVFFGVAANAALGVANQVNGQINAFVASFSQAYNPQIIKSYVSGNEPSFRKILFSSSKMSFYLLFILVVPLYLNIDFVLGLWLTIVPEQTSKFLLFIVIYSLIDAYSAPLWTGVHATGKLRTHQIIMSSIKILNIPIGFIVLKLGAPAWSIFASMACLNFVCSIVRPIYVHHLYKLPLREYFSQVFSKVYIVSAICLPLPIWIASLYESSFERLLVSVPLFFVIALPTIYFIGLSVKERELLRDILLSKISCSRFHLVHKHNSLLE